MGFDPKSVNVGPAVDPMDAIKQAEGTYQDNAERMSQQEKLDYMPKGPDPNPFTLKGGKKK